MPNRKELNNLFNTKAERNPLATYLKLWRWKVWTNEAPRYEDQSSWTYIFSFDSGSVDGGDLEDGLRVLAVRNIRNSE